MHKEGVALQVDADLKFLSTLDRGFISNESGEMSAVMIGQVLANQKPLYMNSRPKKLDGVSYQVFIKQELQKQINADEAMNAKQLKKAARDDTPLEYPFKSKYSQFREKNGMNVQLKKTLPDHPLKKYSKGLMKPIFSFEPGTYQADLLTLARDNNNRIKGYILFLININTKYVYTKEMTQKSMTNAEQAFTSIIRKIRSNGFPINVIKSDAEKAFGALFKHIEGITLISSGSPHTNHVRIIDRVMKTFRDALGVDVDNNIMDNFSLIKKLRNYYNHTPHKALRMYKKTYTPHDLQHNVDLEWSFIRLKISELQDVRQNLQQRGLLSFKPGNILQCALSSRKAGDIFDKKRRAFDKLAMFLEYRNGNAVIRILYPLTDRVIDVPLYRCNFVCNSFDELLGTNLGVIVMNTFNCDLLSISNSLKDRLDVPFWLEN